LSKLVSQDKIVLRSKFLQTVQQDLKPSMSTEVKNK